jgi:hypothetical protein
LGRHCWTRNAGRSLRCARTTWPGWTPTSEPFRVA